MNPPVRAGEVSERQRATHDLSKMHADESDIGERDLAIWRLEPIDLSDHNWRASGHREAVIVRADDEQRARDLATFAFGKAAEKQGIQETPVVPWHYDQNVSCTELKESEFDADGPDSILDPPGYDDEWRRVGI